jgi:hypothetical protein
MGAEKGVTPGFTGARGQSRVASRSMASRPEPPMDILFVGPLTPLPGGAAISMSQLLIGLAGRGHAVRRDRYYHPRSVGSRPRRCSDLLRSARFTILSNEPKLLIFLTATRGSAFAFLSDPEASIDTRRERRPTMRTRRSMVTLPVVLASLLPLLIGGPASANSNSIEGLWHLVDVILDACPTGNPVRTVVDMKMFLHDGSMIETPGSPGVGQPPFKRGVPGLGSWRHVSENHYEAASDSSDTTEPTTRSSEPRRRPWTSSSARTVTR